MFAVLLNHGLELLSTGTDQLVDFLASLNCEEGRHRCNTELLRKVFGLVNIDLDEHSMVLVSGLKLLEEGADHLAWTAPCGEEVNEYRLVTSVFNDF